MNTDKNTIKRLLRENLTNQPKKVAVGILIKCTTTENILLVLRNDKVPVWNLVSGGVNSPEKPIECLKREMKEELSVEPSRVDIQLIGVEDVPSKHLEFHYYQGFTFDEFNVILDNENTDYGWFSKDNLPEPLFEGLYRKIIDIQ